MTGIFFLALSTFWNSISTTEVFTNNPTSSAIGNNMQVAANNFDTSLVIAYFGVHLGILVTAFLLRTHPVVYIGSIFITLLLALIAAPLSNAWSTIIGTDALSVAASGYPLLNFIMDQLPMFEVIWAILTSIVLFGLARNEGII